MLYNNYAKQIEYLIYGDILSLGHIIPFLGIYCFLNLVKTQISRTVYVNNIPISFSICLATIGVCVFRCADFGWRTFYLPKKQNKIKRRFDDGKQH